MKTRKLIAEEIAGTESATFPQLAEVLKHIGIATSVMVQREMEFPGCAVS
jgi:hypothetical protein